MSMPLYTSLAVAEQRGLVPAHRIARVLGKDRRQVHMWIVRRRNSKFPMPEATYRSGTRILDLYRLTGVVIWFRNYAPMRGGRVRS
jgi:adenine/guanine phosphoribosyltransferase-like PRPP-binding protein